MFKTILIAVAAVNAIQITQDETAPVDTAVEKVVDAMTGDESLDAKVDKVRDMAKKMTGDDVKDAIDGAAEAGLGLEDLESMMAGIEATGEFDKHDLHAWAMEACSHFEVTEEGLDDLLTYAGEKLEIDAAEGEDLLETIGETFDISEEEFNASMAECLERGAEAKKVKKCKKDKKGKKAPKEEGEDMPATTEEKALAQGEEEVETEEKAAKEEGEAVEGEEDHEEMPPKEEGEDMEEMPEMPDMEMAQGEEEVEAEEKAAKEEGETIEGEEAPAKEEGETVATEEMPAKEEGEDMEEMPEMPAME